MNPTTKIIFSFVLAAIIAGGGALLGAASEMEQGQGVGEIGSVTWLVIGVTAIVAAAKDFRTYLAPPPSTPPSGGGSETG